MELSHARSSIIRTAVITLLAAGVVSTVWILLAKSRTVAFPLERELTPTSLAQESDLVIVGTFEKKIQQRIEKDTSAESIPLTDWKVTPVEVWKGTPPAQLVVTIFGGRINVRSFEDEHLKPKAGLQGLMYLKYIPEKSSWVLLSTSQGFFTQQNGKYVNPVNMTFEEQALKVEVDKVNANQETQ